MKQLLIVNSAKALNAGLTGSPLMANDLSALQKGAITFFNLGDNAVLSSIPTANFGIALGRGSNSPAFVIPEVDVNTLSVVKASYSAGTKFKRIITIPTITSTDAGKTYGIALVKKGTVPHERNTWSFTQYIDKNSTNVKVATAIKESIESNLGDKFSVTQGVSGSTLTAELTIEAKTFGEGWELVLLEDLYGNSTVITSNTSSVTTNYVDGKPAIGDKDYVQELASKCAAGKGFTDTYADGATVYKGYPEEVEDVHYDVYTLRFQVGRNAAKTRDEKVWQIVHIAVPVTNASGSSATSANILNAILPEGDFMSNKINAAATAAVAAANE